MEVNEKKSLGEFDTELEQMHLRGQWKYDELLVQAIGGPRPAGIPYVWKWAALYPKLLEACEVLPESYTARRHLAFLNPGLPRGGATHTILMGLQMVRPGELAWAHRHSISALRFVVKGNGNAFTVVDGEVCPMEDYDLILTPQWSWHDHHNESAEHVVWLDVLDVPLILGLNAPFYQPYVGDRQQVRRSTGSEYLQARAGSLRPTWEQPRLQRLPLRYRWSDVESQLRKMANLEGSPYDGISLEYVNPMTGQSALPSLGCWIQMLRPGEETRLHRHVSSAVYFVVRGEGETVVGDQRLQWGQYDSLAVPNWSWHQHINRSRTEEAILFSANDIPVFQAFGLYREEPEESLQMKPAPLVPSPPLGESAGKGGQKS